MTYIEAVILGLVQGLTEFLPISSSAHLRIVGGLLSNNEPGAAFTAITQIGTETAVLIYFWKDIVRIITRWFQGFMPAKTGVSQGDPDVRMGWMIIIGTLPIGILGLLFQDLIETTLRNLWITVSMLIIFGLILGLADCFGSSHLKLNNLSWKHALIFGFAQSLALIPGVSRSGGTITAGRILGYSRSEAARYSFLLAMPAIYASGLLEAVKSVGDNPAGWGQTIVATLIAFLVGYAVIVWFMRLISQRSFAPFVYYRVALALVVAGAYLGGVIV